ncbi:unnamed protein product [Brachionus calyciflorus]|uniref:Uncharacterized protein n=1 Tax=Brachionus calyciflorus TaxID=104777 RepID=A0A814I5Y6_9BILA|nr:unnamed protein product [Brachionus calyciflorus]
MIRSYKNPDFIYNLSPKELENYYKCYSHHHFNRHKCQSESDTILDKTYQCVCKINSDKHFCTCKNLEQKNDKAIMQNDSLMLCEYIRPSYTSKEDQIKDMTKMIIDLKKSKLLMRQTMKDLDSLIEIEKKADSLNEVEKFYRSDKFIGSSLKISLCKDELPRSDIKPAKYIYELNSLNDVPLLGNSIFSIKKNANFKSNSSVVVRKVR